MLARAAGEFLLDPHDSNGGAGPLCGGRQVEKVTQTVPPPDARNPTGGSIGNEGRFVKAETAAAYAPIVLIMLKNWAAAWSQVCGRNSVLIRAAIASSSRGDRR